jgi:hypothetical protein
MTRMTRRTLIQAALALGASPAWGGPLGIVTK